MTWVPVVSGVVIAVLGIIGGVWTAKVGAKASPYQVLADRVTVLEKQRADDLIAIEDQGAQIVAQGQTIRAVISDRDAVVAYLIVFREWVSLGAKPPVPSVPVHLQDVIPAWDWPGHRPDQGGHDADHPA